MWPEELRKAPWRSKTGEGLALGGDVGTAQAVVWRCVPSRVEIVLGQWEMLEEVQGPSCGRLGSQAGKVAEQKSDIMKAVNGILFMPRILINALLPQMLGRVLYCPLLMLGE